MLEAKVIKIIDDYQIVINKGLNSGIKDGDRFLVYTMGEELKDPDTGESLGNLEIVCGEAIVTHTQDKIATLESDLYENHMTKRIIKKGGYMAIFGGQVEEIEDPKQEKMPFKNLSSNCLVKQIG